MSSDALPAANTALTTERLFAYYTNACSYTLRRSEMTRRVRVRTIIVPRARQCPDCGGPLVHAEGCVTCPVCGFSACA
jgi:hypothetical protein